MSTAEVRMSGLCSICNDLECSVTPAVQFRIHQDISPAALSTMLIDDTDDFVMVENARPSNQFSRSLQTKRP